MTRLLLLVLSAGATALQGCANEEGRCEGLVDSYAYFPLDGAGRWTYARTDADDSASWTAELDPQRWRFHWKGVWVHDMHWSVACGDDPNCDPTWTRTAWYTADPGLALTILRWEESSHPLYLSDIQLLEECATEATDAETFEYNEVVNGQFISGHGWLIELEVSTTACPRTEFDAGSDCVHLQFELPPPIPIPTEMYFARGTGLVAFSDETGSYQLTDFEWTPNREPEP